jgi:hypothetical protein
VSSLVTAGHLAAAEQLARLSDNRDARDEVALGITRRAAEAGDLQEALSAADSITGKRPHGTALTVIAEKLAGTGDIAPAERIARSIDNPDQEAEALEMIVRTMVTVGREQRTAWRAPRRLRQAMKIARSVSDPAARTSAMTAVLSAAWQAGAGRRVQAIAEEIVITSYDLTQHDGHAALNAVRALVACGAARQAKTVGHVIDDPYYRSIAMAALVSAFDADLDHADRLAAEAVTTARSIAAAPERGRALARVAAELARVGHRATALTAIGAIPQPGPQAAALVDMADRTGQGALVAEALAAVRATGVSHERAEASFDLVPKLCSTGHPDHAAEVFAEGVAAGSPRRRLVFGYSSRLAKAADALVEAGRGDEAEAVIRSMSDPWWRAQALAGLARTLTLVDTSGRPSALAADAVEAACSLDPAHDRAQALKWVAEYLADGQPAAARRAVAAELREGSGETIGLAMRLDPAVADTVMDLMLATKPDHL